MKREHTTERGAQVFHEFEFLKARGYKGGTIGDHRALRKFVFGRTELLTSATLAAALTGAWLLALPFVSRGWRWSFEVWLHWLGLPSATGHNTHRLLENLSFSVPYLLLPAGPAARHTILLTAFVSLAVIFISFVIPKLFTPLRYLLRSFVAVQASALFYFSFYPNRIPLPDYTYTFVASGLVMISLVPVLLGLTYYIFDFGVRRKILLTALVMFYLVVFIPLQVLAHAVIIHHSVIFMPLLYVFFGIFLDVFVFIALYSWAMSWGVD